MPIKSPTPKQKKSEYVSQCMSDLSKEFPDQKQRAAVCYSKWKEKESKASVVVEEDGDSVIFGENP